MMLKSRYVCQPPLEIEMHRYIYIYLDLDITCHAHCCFSGKCCCYSCNCWMEIFYREMVPCSGKSNHLMFIPQTGKSHFSSLWFVTIAYVFLIYLISGWRRLQCEARGYNPWYQPTHINTLCFPFPYLEIPG